MCEVPAEGAHLHGKGQCPAEAREEDLDGDVRGRGPGIPQREYRDREKVARRESKPSRVSRNSDQRGDRRYPRATGGTLPPRLGVQLCARAPDDHGSGGSEAVRVDGPCTGLTVWLHLRWFQLLRVHLSIRQGKAEGETRNRIHGVRAHSRSVNNSGKIHL